ncbi:hypothetical protein [Pseudoalteromonas apostichopi]|uniref:hypothetical protein n=1 Tax=Pseudoalteromonas apostichopi TaxID=3035452 RepID=UPI0025734E66|nr:hypothetical protein [Pseudoalteromonas sp. FE4]
MKILVITTSYGIYSDSHTIRLSNILGDLAKQHQISICYPGKDLVSSIPRLTPLPVGLSFKFKILEMLRVIHEKLFLAYLNVLKRISNPDMYSGFDKLVEQNFEGSTSFEFDIIITASGSIESHRAGYLLSKKYNVPLICDYGDPISPLIANSDKRKSIEDIERKILENATSVLFTTDSTLSQYAKLFDIGSKSHVIRYGFNPDEIENATCERKVSLILESTKNIKYISHIGTAFVNDRSLFPLIDAVSNINSEVGLILAGRRSSAFSNHANQLNIKNFIDLDKVDYSSSLYLQCKSNVNVIVGNKDGRQVPGKVFIAIGCKQPILYISQCDEEQDEALKILNDYPSLFIAKNNKNSIKEVIEIMLESDTASLEVASFGKQYESRSISNQLEKIIYGS